MRFERLASGDWLDMKTELAWKGRDEKNSYSFKEAAIIDFGEYRLPAIEELKGIVDISLEGELKTALPNMKPTTYWSASPYAYYSSFAWRLNFYYGDSSYYHRYFSYRVRLIRK